VDFKVAWIGLKIKLDSRACRNRTLEYAFQSMGLAVYLI